MAQEEIAEGMNRIAAQMQGYAVSAALKAGLDLNIFTLIAKGSDTPEKIAAARDLRPRATRILCDALVASRVIAKADGRYSLPPASAMMLVEDSPAFVGGFAKIALNPLMMRSMAQLTEVVKAGHSILEAGAEAADNPFWHDFNLGSRQMAAATAPALGELAASIMPTPPRRILDIACGSGLYGFEMLKKFPEAQLTSVDWPGVLDLTRPLADQMGLRERVEFRPGDIFNDDLGSSYDLILAVNIYHHFSIVKNLELSRRLYEAGGRGARLIVVDMVPDEAREKNSFALMFALTMLFWTQEGDTYTRSEYARMLEPAGFTDLELKEVAAPRPVQAIVARR